MSPHMNDLGSDDATVPSVRPVRVLVVDDEPDTVATLVALLREERYDAQGHTTAMAAIQALRDFDPDVIISDIAMPGMTGWELGKQVREAMGFKRPMLIAISGEYTKSSDRALAYMYGYNHYLVKPADPTELMALLEKARPR